MANTMQSTADQRSHLLDLMYLYSGSIARSVSIHHSARAVG